MESKKILVYLSQKYEGNWNKIFDEISAKKEFDEEEANSYLKKVKSNYITMLDPEYPESLKNVYKPPFVLYYRGDISLISDTHNKLSVVGSRKATEYGLEVTDKLVSEVAKDFVIISGLAYGVDSAAHKACINNGGRTVAVLGHGLNMYYLEDNAELFKEIEKNHLILTEFPDDVGPQPYYFPIRNRIIAGLSETLLITEGHLNSGTQVTAHLMARKGGNVCCVPTHIGEESLCNVLISQGAFLVENADDLYFYSNVVRPKPIFES